MEIENESVNQSGEKKGKPPMYCAGIVTLVVGVILLILFLSLRFGLDPIVSYEVRQQIIVTSNTSEGYDEWLTSCLPNLPPIYEIYSLFNLTNYEGVLMGEKPVLEKVGPYYYLYCQDKVDVNFSSDGNMVEYSLNDTFFFDEELSNGTEDDIVYSINLLTLAALSYSGNENLIAVGPIYGYLAGMAHYFNEVFPALALNQYFMNRTLTGRAEVTASDLNGDSQEYLTVWTNYTSANITANGWSLTEWKYIYLAPFNYHKYDTPTLIPVDLCNQLWDPTVPFSLMNPSYISQAMWTAADGGNTKAKEHLYDQFPDLTQTQFDTLVYWRNRSKEYYLPEFKSYLNTIAPSTDDHVKSFSDIGGLQWCSLLVLGGESIYEYAPETRKEFFRKPSLHLSKEEILRIYKPLENTIPSFFPPEIFYFQNLTGETKKTFTVTDWHTYFSFDSFFSIISPEDFGIYMFCEHIKRNGGGTPTQKGECDTFLVARGLIGEKSETMHNYIWNYIYPQVAEFTFLPQTGLGLIDKKTVGERLWDGVTAFAANNSINDPNSTYYTGNNDTSLLGNIYAYDGYSELCSYNGPNCTFLEGFWPEPTSVNGSGNGLQFGIGTGENGEDQFVWTDTILRTVVVGYNGTAKVMGVDGYRFIVDETNTPLVYDPDFDQYIYGFANMSHDTTQVTAPYIEKYIEITTNEFGTKPPFNYTRSEDYCIIPIFVSFPDFYLADEGLASTVVVPPPNATNDQIILVVEPNTGMTIDGVSRLQENVYLRNEEKEQERVANGEGSVGVVDWHFYANITGPSGEVMWPLISISEYGAINKDVANTFVLVFEDTEALANYSLWVGVPIACILIITGSMLIYLSVKQPREDYQTIN